MAARHLGQINGHFVVENEVPDAEFLFRDPWQGYVEWCHSDLDRLEAHRHDPRVLAVYDEATTTARLLGSSIHWFFRGRMDEVGHLADSILTGYLEGLRDVVWDRDAVALEQVFLAIAETVYGFSYTGFVGQILGEETERYGRRAYGCTGDQVERHRRGMGEFFSDMGTRYLTSRSITAP